MYLISKKLARGLKKFYKIISSDAISKGYKICHPDDLNGIHKAPNYDLAPKCEAEGNHFGTLVSDSSFSSRFPNDRHAYANSCLLKSPAGGLTNSPTYAY